MCGHNYNTISHVDPKMETTLKCTQRQNAIRPTYIDGMKVAYSIYYIVIIKLISLSSRGALRKKSYSSNFY